MFYTSNASLLCLNEVVKGNFLNKLKYPMSFLSGVKEKIAKYLSCYFLSLLSSLLLVSDTSRLLVTFDVFC